MNGCGCLDPAVFGHVTPCPLGVPGGTCTLGPGPCTCHSCVEARRVMRERSLAATDAWGAPR